MGKKASNNQRPAVYPIPWGLGATMGFLYAAWSLMFLIQAAVAIPFLLAEQQQFRLAPAHFMMELLANGMYLALAILLSTPAATGLLVLFAKLRKGYPVREYLGLRKVPGEQLLRWLAVSVGFVMCSAALTWLLGRSVVTPVMLDLYTTAGAAPLLLIATLVVAPVCEEITFRGFLFEGIRFSPLGSTWAVVLSALAFSAVHIQYDVYGIVTVFAVGTVLGIARLKTGSLYVTIAMHFLHNLVAAIQVLWVLNA